MNQVVFRPVKISDIEAVYRWVKEMEAEDTFIMMNAKEPLTKKEVNDYIVDQIKKEGQKKVVKLCVFAGEKYLGACDITKLARRQGHIGSFGIALSKECRGQGIGLKLAQETIKQAWEKLGITKVILNCFANNKVGISFYDKLGFKQYGLLPQAVLYHGKLEDEIMFYKDLE